MDQEFNDINDVLLDIFIDQLHAAAEMELDSDETTAWVSSSADRATASKQLVAGSNPA